MPYFDLMPIVIIKSSFSRLEDARVIDFINENINECSIYAKCFRSTMIPFYITAPCHIKTNGGVFADNCNLAVHSDIVLKINDNRIAMLFRLSFANCPLKMEDIKNG